MTAYNDVFIQLQDYMLDDVNMKRSLEMKLNNNLIQKKNKQDSENRFELDSQNKSVNKLFIPKEQDTLFWCFFILKNGEYAYETVNHKNEIIARQIKIEFVDKIRKNKQIVKMYKFDTLCNLESNLANDKFLNVKTFLSLCAIENINILFIDNKIYYELMMNDSKEVFVIFTKSGNKYQKKYGFEKYTMDKTDSIKEKLYKVENIDKPIKAISAYKVEELLQICNKLAIETVNKDNGKNKSKKDLYESIIQYF